MKPRKNVKPLLVVSFVAAVLMLVEYEYWSETDYLSPANAALRQNVRLTFESNTTLKTERVHFEGESRSEEKCAIPLALNADLHHLSKTKWPCKLSILDPFHPQVMKAITPVASLNCKGRLFTEFQNGKFRLLDDVRKEHEIVEVFAEPIYRKTDYDVKLGQRIFVNLTKREARVNSDFLKVTVRFKNGKIQSDFHAAISEIDDVAKEKETHIAPLNIMILTFDGTSTAHFKRLLPKTYAYLRDGLDSIFFKGYSIVGESTTPAMTAFLTGKSVSENCEFKEARRGYKNSSYVDKWPFIFKELKRLGIATMWSEDQPGIGAFHLTLKGFKDQPTDHYGRPLWYAGDKGLCFSSQPQFELQLRYLKSFLKSYPGKRKFGFTFLSNLCHRQPGLAHAADDGLLSFFVSLKDKYLLNDTMFITMADHGARFGVVRESPQGKLEHRLPLLSLTLPPWFKRSYPAQITALVRNTRIISSPFDLHKTMKHLLMFPEKTLVQTDTIGSSLFEPLSEDRKCIDAGIPENYCPCLRWQPISIAHPHVLRAVKVAVTHVNELLMSHPTTAKLCHRIEMKTVLEAYQKIPSLEMHLNLDQENTTCSYQIQFQATPGDGVFEGIFRLDSSGNFRVYGDIDRVNKYGDQPKCIVAHAPSMRPYCICLSQNTPDTNRRV